MEIYVIAPIISFVGGGLGAYLGAYLKKKGENLATREDIDDLVDQVKAVTKATKEIEAKISDEVWGRQRVWEMKRDTLFTLMKAESVAVNVLLSLDAAWEVTKTQPPGEFAALQTKNTALLAWQAASVDFDSARAQSLIVCGPNVEKQINAITDRLRWAANAITKGQIKFREYDKQLFQERQALLDAIRKELAPGH